MYFHLDLGFDCIIFTKHGPTVPIAYMYCAMHCAVNRGVLEIRQKNGLQL